MSLEMLTELLDQLDMPYDVILHPPAVTALETARVEGEWPGHVAKVVIVHADGSHRMFILPADCVLDLYRVVRITGDGRARIECEFEFTRLFPDSEPGAMPPLGPLYHMPGYLDVRLTVHPEIVFNACDHRTSIKMRTRDYLRIASPQIGDFASPGRHAAVL